MSKLTSGWVQSLVVGAAAALILALAPVNGQAQVCTTANWSNGGGVVGVVSTGTQGVSNRRFAGPCAARMLGGSANYLVDDSPASEGSYIVRFYAFLDHLQGQAVIFAALDASDEPLIQVIYNVPSNNDLSLRAWPAVGGSPVDVQFVNVAPGWQEIELVWAASNDPGNIVFQVDGSEQTATVATDGLRIHTAQLGLINGASLTGSADFDDFDSRRTSRPSVTNPQPAGDANADGTLTGADLTSLVNELLGVSFALGQPDCNQDGAITGADFTCIVNQILNP